jgi:hypothetical protein
MDHDELASEIKGKEHQSIEIKEKSFKPGALQILYFNERSKSWL